MKKNKLILAILAFLNCLAFTSFSQNTATNSGGQVNQIQPSIISVPLKTKGQKYRDLIEDPLQGFNRRTAMNVVDNAFKTKGFVTYDFVGQLEKTETASAFTQNAQVDEQDLIVNNSGADIFVTIDIDVSKGTSGTEVTLFLVAREAASGAKLSISKPGRSGLRYTDNIPKLTELALDNIKEDFLNELQLSFTKIVNDGRSVFIKFVLDQDATITYRSEIGTDGDLLSESIGDWLGQNAFKNYVRPGGSTARELVFEDVHLPLKDQATGLNYPIKDFGRLIRKYLKSINVNAEIDYPQQGQIIVTIK